MENPPPSLHELAVAHIASVPFNAWLRLELISIESNSVELKVPWREEFGGAPGMTHGGILASLVDTAAYLVLMGHHGSGGPTVDMRVDYHRSTAGGAVFVRGSLVRAGATISTVDVCISDTENRTIATGRCVYLSQPRVRAASPARARPRSAITVQK